MALKYKFNTIILWGMIVFLVLISSLLFYRIEVSKAIINMSIGFFGKQKGFYEIELPFKTICNYIQEFDDQIIITQSITEYSADIELIYFRSAPFIPMLSGRFFNQRDFVAYNNVAVIGKNIESQTYKQNNVRFIQVGNDAYRILGVIGSNISTAYDDKILINGLAKEQLTKNRYYYVDYLGESPTKQRENFQEAIESMSKTEVKLKSIDATMASSMLLSTFADLYDNRWYLFLGICDFISMLLVTIQWLRAKRPLLRIMRLCGYSPLISCKVVVGNYCINALIACFLGFLLTLCIVPPHFALLTSIMLLVPIILLIGFIGISCYLNSIDKNWENDL